MNRDYGSTSAIRLEPAVLTDTKRRSFATCRHAVQAMVKRVYAAEGARRELLAVEGLEEILEMLDMLNWAELNLRAAIFQDTDDTPSGRSERTGLHEQAAPPGLPP